MSKDDIVCENLADDCRPQGTHHCGYLELMRLRCHGQATDSQSWQRFHAPETDLCGVYGILQEKMAVLKAALQWLRIRLSLTERLRIASFLFLISMHAAIDSGIPV